MSGPIPTIRSGLLASFRQERIPFYFGATESSKPFMQERLGALDSRLRGNDKNGRPESTSTGVHSSLAASTQDQAYREHRSPLRESGLGFTSPCTGVTANSLPTAFA